MEYRPIGIEPWTDWHTCEMIGAHVVDGDRVCMGCGLPEWVVVSLQGDEERATMLREEWYRV